MARTCSEIELRTPFEQVVLRSRQVSVGSSAQDAETEYQRQPETVVLRVRIELTPTYPAVWSDRSHPGEVHLRSVDFWRDFTIRLIQKQPIRPKKVSGQPVYSSAAMAYSLLGAEVVVSGPTQVEVLAPDGQRVEAGFDLGDLR